MYTFLHFEFDSLVYIYISLASVSNTHIQSVSKGSWYEQLIVDLPVLQEAFVSFKLYSQTHCSVIFSCLLTVKYCVVGSLYII